MERIIQFWKNSMQFLIRYTVSYFFSLIYLPQRFKRKQLAVSVYFLVFPSIEFNKQRGFVRTYCLSWYCNCENIFIYLIDLCIKLDFFTSSLIIICFRFYYNREIFILIVPKEIWITFILCFVLWLESIMGRYGRFFYKRAIPIKLSEYVFSNSLTFTPPICELLLIIIVCFMLLQI